MKNAKPNAKLKKAKRFSIFHSQIFFSFGQVKSTNCVCACVRVREWTDDKIRFYERFIWIFSFFLLVVGLSGGECFKLFPFFFVHTLDLMDGDDGGGDGQIASISEA